MTFCINKMFFDIIHENKNTLTSEFCDDLIFYYHDVKTSKYIEKHNSINCIYNLKEVGDTKLIYHINNNIKYSQWVNSHLSNLFFKNEAYLIKFDKDIGFSSFNYTFILDGNNKLYKSYQYICFLNNVTNGGELNILGHNVIPEKGKMIIFPCGWCFPFQNNIPYDVDKYILTGFLYEENKLL